MEIIDQHTGYDGNGYLMTTGVPDAGNGGDGPSQPDKFPDHRLRLVVATGVTFTCIAAACVFPPAIGGAIVGFGAVINEARQIPELN